MGSKALPQHPYLDDVAVSDDHGPDRTDGGVAQHRLDWRQLAGGVSVLAGLVVIAAGWFGMSGTMQLSAQLAYMFSGGFAGAALIALGATFFVAFEHHADRQAISALDTKLNQLLAANAAGSERRSP